MDAIIIGSITQFGRDDKKTSVSGDALGRISGQFGLGGVSRNNSKAVVAISARIVDTSTAEILVSVTGRGESTRSGTSLTGAGGGTSVGAGGLDMRNGNFANSILGEAVRTSVNSVAQQLESKAAALPTHVLSIEGLVADASDDGTLILNVGSSSGLKVGDKLSVKRVARKITDPATGKLLRQIEDAIGVVTITEVDAQSATGKFSGPSKPKVGDTVKNQ